MKLCRMFRCTKVEGDWYLTSDMEIQCFTPQWGAYATLSIVMLAVYTLGLPLGIVVVLRKNRRRLQDETVKANLGFLCVWGRPACCAGLLRVTPAVSRRRYLMYGEPAYLWAVAELVRKLVLTSLILLFFDQGSAMQVTFALLVSAFAHVAHSLWRPYTNRKAYLLQHGSLTVTTLSYVEVLDLFARLSWL